MAAATETIGFGVTSSTTYEQPYMLARKFSTLDHLTNGRVAWNVVTSYLESAAKNLGLETQIEHDERYRIADEYVYSKPKEEKPNEEVDPRLCRTSPGLLPQLSSLSRPSRNMADRIDADISTWFTSSGKVHGAMTQFSLLGVPVRPTQTQNVCAKSTTKGNTSQFPAPIYASHLLNGRLSYSRRELLKLEKPSQPNMRRQFFWAVTLPNSCGNPWTISESRQQSRVAMEDH